MQINIKTVGIREIERELGDMKNKAGAVLYNVLKRVQSNLRKNVSKYIIKRYFIKSADVKKTIKYKKPTKQDLTATIYTEGKTIPLMKFHIKPDSIVNLKGISAGPKGDYPKRYKYKVKVLKKKKISLVRHAFVMKMPNGHIGLFRRNLLSGELKKVVQNKNGLYSKINELHGPSVPQMISNDVILEKINKAVEDKYKERLEHELNRVLGRL